MKKDNYEKIRAEVSKKYKDRIAELEIENERLKRDLTDERKARQDMEARLESALQQVCSFPGVLKIASSVLGSHSFGEKI